MLPIVTIKNDRIVTNSRDVADFFKKARGHVLRDIDSLISRIGSQADFIETTVEGRTGKGIRHYRAFDLTRDGFTLLAMRFTGDKALAFQLANIAQFNAMEAALKAAAAPVPTVAIPTSFAEALRLAADQAEKIEVRQIATVC